MPHPVGNVPDEIVGIGQFTQAHQICDNELAFGVNAYPRPGIAVTYLASFLAFPFATDKAPKLVNLDPLGVQVLHKLVVQIGAQGPHVHQQPEHRKFRDATDTGRAVDRVALRETPEDRRSFVYR